MCVKLCIRFSIRIVDLHFGQIKNVGNTDRIVPTKKQAQLHQKRVPHETYGHLANFHFPFQAIKLSRARFHFNFAISYLVKPSPSSTELQCNLQYHHDKHHKV